MPVTTSLVSRLFGSERPRLLKRLARIVRNDADAEDLVQDVFVKVLRAGPAFEAVEAPRHYLNRAATNAALDHLRRQAVRAATLDSDADPAAQASAAPGAELVIQSRQELAALDRAVAALPSRCRVVFLLSRRHGLPMREISARMGVSESTVEKHLLKAMQRCRAALRAAGREI